MCTDSIVVSRRVAFGIAIACLAWLWHISAASGDTTSWVIESVEWQADAYDAILIVRALPPEGEQFEEGEEYPDETIRDGKYPVETIEVLKDYPKAPRGRFLLEKPSGNRLRPGDKLIVFYRSSRAKKIINTSRPTELIHFPRDPQRRKTYTFLGMDATAKVIETHDELVRCLRERVKLEMPPISREEESRVRMGWPDTSAGFEWRLYDDYESHGYDVIIDLLIPLDRHVLDQLEAQGHEYTTPETTYLGSQGIVRHAEAMAKGAVKNSSLARIELPAEKNSPEVALAWARILQNRAARKARHLTPAASATGVTQQNYLLSPDGARLYHLHYNGLRAIEVATGETLYHARICVDPPTAKFTPDGHYLAWRKMDSIAAMDMENGELLFTEKRTGYRESLMFTGDGRRLGYLERSDHGQYRLVLRALAKTSSTTETLLTDLEGRVTLNDLGDTGRYAVLQQEKSRTDRSGLLGPQLLLVETDGGKPILRMPREIIHAAVGSNDRVIATLSAIEQEDAEVDMREFMFRLIDGDEPLVRANIPAQFERCVFLTEDLVAVCTALDAPEQEALLFSHFNDDRRGELLRWAP